MDDDQRLLSGAEVLGGAVGVALLGGAACDLALFSPTTTLIAPAQAGASCDVVVEQTATMFVGQVDVLALPRTGVVAKTGLPGGPVALEEHFPFRRPHEASSDYRITWDERGASLAFDASDRGDPSRTVVRVDCP